MKRYIRSTSNISIIDEIASEFGQSNPGTGCAYIAQDGTFIQLYPRIDVHEDLCEWIESELSYPLEYKDEEYAIREFGWIRIRKDPNSAIIELTGSKPTNYQMYSLEDWLYMLEDSNVAKINMGVLDSGQFIDVPFNSDCFTEDVIKIVKRYYGSKILSY